MHPHSAESSAWCQKFIARQGMMIILCIVAIFLSEIKCGTEPKLSERNQRQPRILDGTQAQNGSYKYVVSVRSPRVIHICGGTIVSPSVILTAAHCVYDLASESMSVMALSNQLTSRSLHNVATKVLHENFTRLTTEFGNCTYNDVALLKLEKPIENIEASTDIARLCNEKDTRASSTGTALGWGSWGRRNNENTDGFLQKVDLTLISKDNCQARFGDFFHDSQICTYDYGEKRPYKGDSGGPLMINHCQAGVISWSRKNKTISGVTKIFPVTYADITVFKDWVDDKVKILTDGKEKILA